ncbi:MAG: transporter substrate-binding domain-containing protein, partial [Phascolarctobacterium sp.]|nr:transporter substrate-binding domain-containing protein [Phascolarctobacterium sp.]
MKKLLIMMMAILAACSLLLAGCGGGEKKAAAPEKIMRVATEPSFAPFEFQKEGSKEFTGFDMDLIRA